MVCEIHADEPSQIPCSVNFPGFYRAYEKVLGRVEASSEIEISPVRECEWLEDRAEKMSKGFRGYDNLSVIPVECSEYPFFLVDNPAAIDKYCVAVLCSLLY
jgi:hypothetical protein